MLDFNPADYPWHYNKKTEKNESTIQQKCHMNNSFSK